ESILNWIRAVGTCGALSSDAGRLESRERPVQPYGPLDPYSRHHQHPRVASGVSVCHGFRCGVCLDGPSRIAMRYKLPRAPVDASLRLEGEGGVIKSWKPRTIRKCYGGRIERPNKFPRRP